jgi:hypothetical protein
MTSVPAMHATPQHSTAALQQYIYMYVIVTLLHCYIVFLLSQVWRSSTFGQRRQLLKILLKYIIAHQQEICRCEMFSNSENMRRIVPY